MKTRLVSLIVLSAFAFGPIASAQDSKAQSSTTNLKQSGSTSEAPAKPKAETARLNQDQLEANFKATLTKATLKGRWCAIKDGQLGPEKEDKYSIRSITKIGGDIWLITARIQYGKNDFVAPVPIQVKWAGDTPVITLDKVGV